MEKDKEQTKESLLPQKKQSNLNKSFHAMGMGDFGDTYKDFKDDNKVFWIVLNVCTFQLAFGLILGTLYVLNDNVTDCGGIRQVLWLNIVLHSTNLLVTIFNICGWEAKLFNCNMICGYAIFSMAIFVFMQFVYFEAFYAQECITTASKMYFWLMFQIVIIWISFSITVCFFFRKYCQVPPEAKPKKMRKKPKKPQDPMDPQGPAEEEETEEETDTDIEDDEEEDFLGHDPKAVHEFETQLNNITSAVFTDKDFPANRQSLQGNSPKRIQSAQQIVQIAEWRRATDFLASDIPEIIKDGISPLDMRQGLIGNCYLLAAIASLAEWPNRIERMLATKKKNRKCLYGVHLYKDGIYQTIWIDNYFPVMGRQYGMQGYSAGDPLSAKTVGGELWAALIEKAYAKAHGSYETTAGGIAGFAMRHITGAPTFTYMFNIAAARGGKVYGRSKGEDDLWNDMIFAEKTNYAMTAGTPGTDQGRTDARGIVPGHAYTVLGAKEVTDRNGQSIKIVQVRNPWGKSEWKGRFSDSSSDWTEALKAECGWTNEEDGKFWMPFDDMFDIFMMIDICKYDDKSKFSFKKVNDSSNGYVLIPFKVKQSTQGLCTFAVTQRSDRTEESEGNHRFSQTDVCQEVTVGIAKVTNKKAQDLSQKVQAVRGYFRQGQIPLAMTDVYLEFEGFEAGDYYMYADINRARQQTPPYSKEFSVNCYGACDVDFGEDESRNQSKQMAIQCTDAKGQPREYSRY